MAGWPCAESAQADGRIEDFTHDEGAADFERIAQAAANAERSLVNRLFRTLGRDAGTRRRSTAGGSGLGFADLAEMFRKVALVLERLGRLDGDRLVVAAFPKWRRNDLASERGWDRGHRRFAIVFVWREDVAGIVFFLLLPLLLCLRLQQAFHHRAEAERNEDDDLKIVENPVHRELGVDG